MQDFIFQPSIELSLTHKHWTCDHGIEQFIETPFLHLLFKSKSKFVFLIDGGMYPKIFTNLLKFIIKL
jgi:hypothetical protein